MEQQTASQLEQDAAAYQKEFENTAKSWAIPIHQFGTRQNALNAAVLEQLTQLTQQLQEQAEQIRQLQEENQQLRTAMQKITHSMQKEHVLNEKINGRVSLEIGKIQKEVNALRLSGKLNSNAIDRLMKQAENQSG